MAELKYVVPAPGVQCVANSGTWWMLMFFADCWATMKP